MMKPQLIVTAGVVAVLAGLYLYFFNQDLGNTISVTRMPTTEPARRDAPPQSVVNEVELPINDMLKQVATETNEKLPMMIDAETRWDTMTAGDMQIGYAYTMVNYTAEEIDRFNLEEALTPDIVNAVCNTPDLRLFTDTGVTMVYRYSGKHGKPAGKIVVPPSACGEK